MYECHCIRWQNIKPSGIWLCTLTKLESSMQFSQKYPCHKPYTIAMCNKASNSITNHTHIQNTHPQLVSSRLSPTCSEAMPKSAILILFLSSSRRFSGFRSLWLQEHRGQAVLNTSHTHNPPQKKYFEINTAQGTKYFKTLILHSSLSL